MTRLVNYCCREIATNNNAAILYSANLKISIITENPSTVTKSIFNLVPIVAVDVTGKSAGIQRIAHLRASNHVSIIIAIRDAQNFSKFIYGNRNTCCVILI